MWYKAMGNPFVVRSRQIFTGNDSAPRAAALLIDGKQIHAILPWDYMGSEGAYQDLPCIDYGDQLIIPSFMDAHTHLFTGAINASPYVCNTLGECQSEDECAERIAQFAKDHPEYKKIRGNGWFVGAWKDSSFPDKRSLDKAVPDRPVYLTCADSHSMWVNSKALEEMNLPKNYTPASGEACRFPDGSFSGLFLEPDAYQPAKDRYMDFTEHELYEIHRNFQQVLAANGICALSEMTAFDYRASKDHCVHSKIIRRLDQNGQLSSHIYDYPKLFGYVDFTPFWDYKKEMESEHFHIAGVKGFVDGVTESYTGLLLEPYTDRPDTYGEGVPLRPKNKMQQEIMAANQEGIQVRLHCIADGSVRMALDMYEASSKKCDIVPLRNTIEHIENIHPDDIPRFPALGVIPSMQPYHLVLSNNGKINCLGKERCRYEFPIRSMWEECGMLAIGTDYPVIDLNPFMTIHSAVSRCDEKENPCGQNAMDQKLPMSAAIKGYTKDSAFVYHEESRMGTIDEGKLANFLVLSQNLFQVNAKQIEKTRVCVNYFEGKEVYHE